MSTPRLLVKRPIEDATPKQPAATTGPAEPTNTDAGPEKKAAGSGVKMIIRRLPPAMTEAEFLAILAPEWHVGNGKVDWAEYIAGKVTINPSKNSTPSRVYMHLINIDDAGALSEFVQKTTWEDAKSSWNDPSLLGPPVVERAIYKRVPTAKKKTDPRQGTIDQDPEFQAFLASLTEPPTKEVDAGEGGDESEDDKNIRMTTTPLIEFLKEKKLREEERKLKEKHAKIAATKAKAAAAVIVKEEAKKSKEKAQEKPKEPIRILKKGSEVPASVATESSKAEPSQATSTKSASTSEAPTRRRVLADAARILRRDLGLNPAAAQRKARQDAAKAEAKAEAKGEGKEAEEKKDSKAEPESKTKDAAKEPAKADKDSAAEPQTAASASTSASATAPSSTPKARTRGGRGRNSDKNKASAASESRGSASTGGNPPAPIILLRKKPENAETPEEPPRPETTAPEPATDDAPAPSTSQAAQKPQVEKAAPPSAPGKAGPSRQAKKGAPAITSGATQGFIKNVKGVDDGALKEKLEEFGTLAEFEFKKNKGHVYLEFKDHDALVKAAAGQITVGQTSLHVVERRDKPPKGETAGPPADDTKEKEKEKEKDSSRRSGRGRRGRGKGGGKPGAGGDAATDGGDGGAE